MNDPPAVNVCLDMDALEDSMETCKFLINHGVRVRLTLLEEKDPSVLGFYKTNELIQNTPLMDEATLMKMKLNL